MAEETTDPQAAPQPAPQPQAAPQPAPQPQPQPQAAPQPQPAPAPQPQPQPQAAPQPQPQPVYIPAPLMKLTGGMKFGWFVVGAFLNVGGILIAWLANADKVPQVKNDALKFALIGFFVWLGIGILVAVLFSSLLIALIASVGSGVYDAGSMGYSYF